MEEGGLVVQQQPEKEKAMSGDDVVFSCLPSGCDPEGMGVQWVVHGHKERHTILEGNQTGQAHHTGGQPDWTGTPYWRATRLERHTILEGNQTGHAHHTGGQPDWTGTPYWRANRLERHTILEGNQTSDDAFAGWAFLSGNPTAGDSSMMLRNVSRVDCGVYHCLLIPRIWHHCGWEWDPAQHPQGTGTVLNASVLLEDTNSAV
ncbi:immunoglobulin superfamily member [Oncorhynchus tshawytscha]|uniref:immunoglobulin superfamily member n=1 Tax=Oncorhynchus tshawytscha TaxID=74940 RepID=UPI000D0A8448|nr:immunoglobulin superfamily member [Oncorhynchus tshawytscha]